MHIFPYIRSEYNSFVDILLKTASEFQDSGWVFPFAAVDERLRAGVARRRAVNLFGELLTGACHSVTHKCC